VGSDDILQQLDIVDFQPQQKVNKKKNLDFYPSAANELVSDIDCDIGDEFGGSFSGFSPELRPEQKVSESPR
jgi:hypothetical protein